jgi:hypothetical protein
VEPVSGRARATVTDLFPSRRGVTTTGECTTITTDRIVENDVIESHRHLRDIHLHTVNHEQRAGISHIGPLADFLLLETVRGLRPRGRALAGATAAETGIETREETMTGPDTTRMSGESVRRNNDWHPEGNTGTGTAKATGRPIAIGEAGAEAPGEKDLQPLALLPVGK